ncbi:TnsD family Tn7-like transposition protein [Cupriavidus pampae]|uniref:Transposon Tn7 transposition protein TnsD C-terminal domain-containing protein n=1 Tax=Cupriavidus pampae TaxID=659251 RepID=A0ABM8XSU7_9BURK|nr:TnsD family Tn7-like transposition protein [Cupriavidus pampae]CAG9183397.1 hypothetical protein LMG32289_05367 [Cupriavidus pampae]
MMTVTTKALIGPASDQFRGATGEGLQASRQSVLQAVGALTPRDRFEAASSIADSLFGTAPRVRLGGRTARSEIAYDTVSWPLALLSACGDGYYGSSEQLLARTLVPYCQYQYMPPGREALRRRAIHGEARFRSPPWAPWMVRNPPGRKTCPVCAAQSWQTLGIDALVWPHMAPMVRACWRHGVQLRTNVAARGPDEHQWVPQPASVRAIAFAKDTVTICELGRSVEGASHAFAAQLTECGLRRPDGTFRTAAFARHYAAYADAYIEDLALCRALGRPRTASAVLHWIRQGGDETLHPVLLVVLLGFLRAAGDSTLAIFSTVARRQKAPPVAHKSWSAQGKSDRLPVDGRERYGLTDVPMLLHAGCSCKQAARLCHVNASTVYRLVARLALWGVVATQRHARLRVRARQIWQALRAKYPQASPNALRKREPQAYAWLWRHDQEWLMAQPRSYCPARGWHRSVLPTPGSPAAALARVRSAIRDMEARAEGPPYSRAELCRRIGISQHVLKTWEYASTRIARAIQRANKTRSPIRPARWRPSHSA